MLLDGFSLFLVVDLKIGGELTASYAGSKSVITNYNFIYPVEITLTETRKEPCTYEPSQLKAFNRAYTVGPLNAVIYSPL